MDEKLDLLTFFHCECKVDRFKNFATNQVEKQLSIFSKCVVVHSKGGFRKIAQHNHKNVVVDCTECNFSYVDEQETALSLATLLINDQLVVTTSNGDVHNICLPKATVKLFPCPYGLLLQRERNSANSRSYCHEYDFLDDAQEWKNSHFMYLSHPLVPLDHVVMDGRDRSDHDVVNNDIDFQFSQDIIGCTGQIFCTINRLSGVLSLWALLPSTATDGGQDQIQNSDGDDNFSDTKLAAGPSFSSNDAQSHHHSFSSQQTVLAKPSSNKRSQSPIAGLLPAPFSSFSGGLLPRWGNASASLTATSRDDRDSPSPMHFRALSPSSSLASAFPLAEGPDHSAITEAASEYSGAGMTPGPSGSSGSPRHPHPRGLGDGEGPKPAFGTSSTKLVMVLLDSSTALATAEATAEATGLDASTTSSGLDGSGDFDRDGGTDTKWSNVVASFSRPSIEGESGLCVGPETDDSLFTGLQMHIACHMTIADREKGRLLRRHRTHWCFTVTAMDTSLESPEADASPRRGIGLSRLCSEDVASGKISFRLKELDDVTGADRSFVDDANDEESQAHAVWRDHLSDDGASAGASAGDDAMSVHDELRGASTAPLSSSVAQVRLPVGSASGNGGMSIPMSLVLRSPLLAPSPRDEGGGRDGVSASHGSELGLEVVLMVGARVIGKQRLLWSDDDDEDDDGEVSSNSKDYGDDDAEGGPLQQSSGAEGGPLQQSSGAEGGPLQQSSGSSDVYFAVQTVNSGKGRSFLLQERVKRSTTATALDDFDAHDDTWLVPEDDDCDVDASDRARISRMDTCRRTHVLSLPTALWGGARLGHCAVAIITALAAWSQRPEAGDGGKWLVEEAIGFMMRTETEIPSSEVVDIFLRAALRRPLSSTRPLFQQHAAVFGRACELARCEYALMDALHAVWEDGRLCDEHSPFDECLLRALHSAASAIASGAIEVDRAPTNTLSNRQQLALQLMRYYRLCAEKLRVHLDLVGTIPLATPPRGNSLSHTTDGLCARKWLRDCFRYIGAKCRSESDKHFPPMCVPPSVSSLALLTATLGTGGNDDDAAAAEAGSSLGRFHPCPSLRFTRSFFIYLGSEVSRVAASIGAGSSYPHLGSLGSRGDKVQGMLWASCVATAFVRSALHPSVDSTEENDGAGAGAGAGEAFTASPFWNVGKTLAAFPGEVKSLIELSLLLCREDPPVGWPTALLQHIDRQDLVASQFVAAGRQWRPQRGSAGALEARMAVKGSGSSNGRDADARARGMQTSASSEASDGLAEAEAASRGVFAGDDRMVEVCRMLRSCRALYLRVEKAPETSDLEHRERLQTRLLTLCRRSLACCVGRGMVTMNSVEPLPLMAEPLPLAPLALMGRVAPTNSIIKLDPSFVSAELTVWPEFHNGAAAGLRVGRAGARSSGWPGLRGLSAAPHSEGRPLEGRWGSIGGRDRVTVTRDWIAYNRALAVAAGKEAWHAGMVFALGLQGHLGALTRPDILDYLSQGHEPTNVAVLLGTAASAIGSADPMLQRALCCHLPALLPQLTVEVETPASVQAAALVGLGLLHCGSGHRLIIEFLLTELTRKPTSDRCDQREALALCAGWSLGMLLLGRGSIGTRLEEAGEVNPTKNGKEATPGPRQGGGGSGMGDPSQWGPGSGPSSHRSRKEAMQGLADLRIEDRLQLLIDGGKRPTTLNALFVGSSHNVDPNSRSSRILEGDVINTNVTAIGGIMALTLIYIRSNNADVGRRLELPSKASAIDLMRPDLLLFRALGRNLVLWDSIEPTHAWLVAQMPQCISSVLLGHAGGPSHALTQSVALEAYLCVSGGSCLALGIAFAGTGDRGAKAAIMDRLKIMQCLRDNKQSSLQVSPTAARTIRASLDMCVCCAALALSCVMAGSGCVDCLRLLRELRWKTEDIVHGTHMGLGMAIGLLFLGGGGASLRRDPLSSACLLMSLCPRFPARTIDNQHHLQSLRHLYAIAAEKRLLQAHDVDSAMPVNLWVEVELRSGDRVRMCTPCLLPELALVRAVHSLDETTDEPASVCKHDSASPHNPDTSLQLESTRGLNDEYFPIHMELDAMSCSNAVPVMFVKRRVDGSRGTERRTKSMSISGAKDVHLNSMLGVMMATNALGEMERGNDVAASMRSCPPITDICLAVMKLNSQ